MDHDGRVESRAPAGEPARDLEPRSPSSARRKKPIVMKTTLAAPTAVLVCAGAALAALVGRSVQFAPEEGTELVETYDQQWLLELSEQTLSIVINDEEVPHDAPEAEIEIETHDVLTFRSEYLEVDEGTPRELRRTLEAVSATSRESATGPDGETAEDEREGETELEGVAILFRWDEDEEAFVASFEEEDAADEDLLERVTGADVLSAFLPEDGDVEAGDTWDVDVLAFQSISNPGGDWGVVKEGDDEDKDAFEEEFYENLDGSIAAEHQGARDEDGREVQVIALELELETSVERSDELDEGAVSTETFTFEFDVAGELLWDSEHHHAVSLSLTGDLSLTLSRVQEAESDQGTFEIDMTQFLEGDYNYEATVTRE